MSNARWWRNLALFVMVLGTAAGIALYGTRPIEGAGDGRRVAQVLVGTAVFWALVSLPFAQRSYQKDARLRRGDGVLLRWTVPPAQWGQFVANETTMQAGEGNHPNLVHTGQRVPGAGIEIIMSTDAVIVGADLHVLTGIGKLGPSGPFWVSSRPPTLEYHTTVTDSTDTFVDRVLRFPVAAGHESAARGLAVN